MNMHMDVNEINAALKAKRPDRVLLEVKRQNEASAAKMTDAQARLSLLNDKLASLSDELAKLERQLAQLRRLACVLKK